MLKFFYILLCSALLIACTPVMVAVTGASVGAKVSQDKAMGSSVSDYRILMSIKLDFAKHPLSKQLSSISVKVNRGSVLMLGNLTDPLARKEAQKIAWASKGVKNVISEIQIEADKSRAITYFKDAWITTMVKVKMWLDSRVRSMSYSVETVDGRVYLFGITDNQEELDIATSIVKSVKGVKKVIAHITIRKPD